MIIGKLVGGRHCKFAVECEPLNFLKFPLASAVTCPIGLAAGGRTSDAAAVRGAAGPDRAVADTHGIDLRWPAQAAESVYKGLGKEKCCKSGGISGNFGGAGADLRPLGTLRMKIVSQCREQAG